MKYSSTVPIRGKHTPTCTDRRTSQHVTKGNELHIANAQTNAANRQVRYMYYVMQSTRIRRYWQLVRVAESTRYMYRISPRNNTHVLYAGEGTRLRSTISYTTRVAKYTTTSSTQCTTRCTGARETGSQMRSSSTDPTCHYNLLYIANPY
jgi:hypothetical protein